MTYVPGEKSKIGDDNKSRQSSQRTKEAVNGKTCTVVIPPYTTGGTAGQLVFKDGILTDYKNPS